MVDWSFNTEAFDKLMWGCKFGILYFSKMAEELSLIFYVYLHKATLFPLKSSLFSTILWLLYQYDTATTIVWSPSYPEGQQVGALLNSSSRTANHMDWVILDVQSSQSFRLTSIQLENLSWNFMSMSRMNGHLRPSPYRNLSNNNIIQF